jgi:hypothetical protein
MRKALARKHIAQATNGFRVAMKVREGHRKAESTTETQRHREEQIRRMILKAFSVSL